MDEKDINALVGAVLRGEYKKRTMRLEEIASTVGIPYGTLRKKIAGQSPIFATELILIAQAIGVPPKQVLDEAVEMYGGLDRLMSEASSKTNDLDTKRKQNEARAMPVEQIEDLPNAATVDAELDSDEPPTA